MIRYDLREAEKALRTQLRTVAR